MWYSGIHGGGGVTIDPIAAASSDDLQGVLESGAARRFAFHLKLLAEFGIRVVLPSGAIRIHPGRIRIGWVQLEPRGRITVQPCEGITVEHFEILARCALRARLDGGEPADRWRRLSDGRLVTAVSVPNA